MESSVHGSQRHQTDGEDGEPDDRQSNIAIAAGDHQGHRGETIATSTSWVSTPASVAGRSRSITPWQRRTTPADSFGDLGENMVAVATVLPVSVDRSGWPM